MKLRHQFQIPLHIERLRNYHLIGGIRISAGPLQFIIAQLLTAFQNSDDFQIENIVVLRIGDRFHFIIGIQFQLQKISDAQIVRFRQPLVDHGDQAAVINFFLSEHPSGSQLPGAVCQLGQLRRHNAQHRHVRSLAVLLTAAGYRFRHDNRSTEECILIVFIGSWPLNRHRLKAVGIPDSGAHPIRRFHAGIRKHLAHQLRIGLRGGEVLPFVPLQLHVFFVPGVKINLKGDDRIHFAPGFSFGLSGGGTD